MEKAIQDYSAESISKFDLNNFRNELLSDSIKYSQQEKKYAKSIIILKSLLGYEEGKNIILIDKLDYELKSYAYDDLKEELLNNNTNLQNELYNLNLLDNAYRRKVATRKPTLRFKNSISDELSTSKFSDEERDRGGILDVYASFSVSYNIFDGGQHRQSLQQSKMDRIIADKRIDGLILKALESLRVNLEEYNRLIDILDMKNNLVQNLAENLSIAENRLANGYSIFIEYRDAKLELSKAQLDVLQTYYELKMAEVEIVQLIGGLLK